MCECQNKSSSKYSGVAVGSAILAGAAVTYAASPAPSADALTGIILSVVVLMIANYASTGSYTKAPVSGGLDIANEI